MKTKVNLKKENYVPIAVICFARPRHLKDMIHALLENPEANNSEIFFFIDKTDDFRNENLNKEVLKICSQKWDFKKTHIITNTINKGLKNQIIDSATFMAMKYPAFILLEDDVMVSKNFLEYMNLSLNKYKNSNVFHINGFNYNNSINKPSKAYVSTLMFSWGWATWSDKWLEFVNTPNFDSNKIAKASKKQINRFSFYGLNNWYNQIEDNSKGKISTWAVFWYQHIILNSGFTISPGRSHTKNLGFDGSGTNSGNKNIFKTKLNNKSTVNFQHRLRACNSNLIVSIFWNFKRKTQMSIEYHINKILNNT